MGRFIKEHTLQVACCVRLIAGVKGDRCRLCLFLLICDTESTESGGMRFDCLDSGEAVIVISRREVTSRAVAAPAD